VEYGGNVAPSASGGRVVGFRGGIAGRGKDCRATSSRMDTEGSPSIIGSVFKGSREALEGALYECTTGCACAPADTPSRGGAPLDVCCGSVWATPGDSITGPDSDGGVTGRRGEGGKCTVLLWDCRFGRRVDECGKRRRGSSILRRERGSRVRGVEAGGTPCGGLSKKWGKSESARWPREMPGLVGALHRLRDRVGSRLPAVSTRDIAGGGNKKSATCSEIDSLLSSVLLSSASVDAALSAWLSRVIGRGSWICVPEMMSSSRRGS